MTKARTKDGPPARFSSPDPLNGNISDPQSLNRYTYALNDPVDFQDPFGLFCVWDDHTRDDEPEDGGVTKEECKRLGGRWVGRENKCDGPCVDPGPGPGIEDDPSNPPRNPKGPGGGGLQRFVNAVKSAVCAALPQGRVEGVSGSIGGIGGEIGTLETVYNYSSGQISMFVSGGLHLGWNGGAQGSVIGGAIYGKLADDNSNYHGGFTTVSGSAPVGGPITAGGYISASSGGIEHPATINPNGPFVVGANVGASLIPGGTGTLAATQYSRPAQVGNILQLGSPADMLAYAARQACK